MEGFNSMLAELIYQAYSYKKNRAKIIDPLIQQLNTIEEYKEQIFNDNSWNRYRLETYIIDPWKKSNLTLVEFLDKILNPVKNNFKQSTAKDLQPINDSRECWIEGPCIIVKHDSEAYLNLITELNPLINNNPETN
jgi:hypothetical protein